jgi:hypothetical protein
MRAFEAMQSPTRAAELQARYAERFGDHDAKVMMLTRGTILSVLLTDYILNGDIASTIAFAKETAAGARADTLKKCRDPHQEEWFATTIDAITADILEDLENVRAVELAEGGPR